MSLETGLLLWMIINALGTIISLITLTITIEKFYAIKFLTTKNFKKKALLLKLISIRLIERSFRLGFFTISLFISIIRYYNIVVVPIFILYVFLVFSFFALVALIIDLYHTELKRRKVFRYVKLNAKKS